MSTIAKTLAAFLQAVSPSADGISIPTDTETRDAMSMLSKYGQTALTSKLYLAHAAAYEYGQRTSSAKEIAHLLPQVEALVAEWNKDYAPRTPEGKWSPFGYLQWELGMTGESVHDGKFGPFSAKILLSHLVREEQQGFPYGHRVDLNDYPALAALVQKYQPDLFAHYVTERDNAKAFHAVRQHTNELIRIHFEQCTDGVIDLSGQDPFGKIVKEITDPFAQIADEQELAAEQVADAIEKACGPILDDHRVPDDVRLAAITALADKLREPLENHVARSINTAQNKLKSLHLSLQGHGISPSFP